MPEKAQFFDGKSAASHDAVVTLRADGLRIEVNGKTNAWSYNGLVLASHSGKGAVPMRITHTSSPGSRLVVSNERLAESLIMRAPHLKGGFNPARTARYLGWAVAGIMLALSLGYLMLNLAPATVAGWMPDGFRDRMGRQTEAQLVKKKRQCNDPAGQKALLRLASRVASGTNNPPDFSLRVYDIKLLNAFAVAGGRMVLTRKLIEKADSPEEVAGVVAHELGHIQYRHPEAALVRIMGVQIIVSLLTGGDGETITSLAGLATLLTYSRSAERQADKYAQDILTKAAIDPVGLKNFFQKVKELQEKSVFGKIPSMFTTHPGTAERIKKLKPLPPGKAKPVLSNEDWKALKNICRK